MNWKKDGIKEIQKINLCNEVWLHNHNYKVTLFFFVENNTLKKKIQRTKTKSCNKCREWDLKKEKLKLHWKLSVDRHHEINNDMYVMSLEQFAMTKKMKDKKMPTMDECNSEWE